MVNPQRKSTLTVEKELYNLLSRVADMERREDVHLIEKEIKRGIKIAKKYHLNKIHFELAEDLYYYYCMHTRDQVSMRRYQQEMIIAGDLRDIEEKARAGYASLSRKLLSTKKPGEKLKAEYRLYFEQMHRYLELENLTISKFIYVIAVNYFYLEKDYDRVIKYCNEAIAFYNTHKTNKSQHFKNALLPLLIMNRSYIKALDLIESTKTQRYGQRFSTSIFLFYEVLVLIHMKEYQRAYELILVSEDKQRVNAAMREEWQIVKGYMQVLINAGRVEPVKQFRVSKLLNEVREYNQDKHGNFVNLLILRIMIDIQKDRSGLFDRLESYKKTARRYCVKGSRHEAFINHLFNFIKNGFKGGSFTGPDIDPENFDLIPFEDLSMILHAHKATKNNSPGRA